MILSHSMDEHPRRHLAQPKTQARWITKDLRVVSTTSQSPLKPGRMMKASPAPTVRAAIRTLQAVFLAYMLFWFFVTQVPRYLAPVYGVGSFLAFHALHQLWVWAGQRRWRKSFTVMPAMRAGDPLSTAPLGGVRPHGLV